MDLSTLTDEQLADHLNAVLAEQERRSMLASAAAQVEALAARYVQGGGNPADLVAAVNRAD